MAEIYHEQRAKELGLPEGTGKRYDLQDLGALAAEIDRLGYSCLMLDGKSTGPLRPLTDEERTILDRIRAAKVSNNIAFMEKNIRAFQAVVEGTPEAIGVRWVTVAFDSREESFAFCTYVIDTKRWGQVNFTNTAVRNSWQVRPKLLEEISDNFHLRPVIIEDYQKAAAKTVSPYPFDTANLMPFP